MKFEKLDDTIPVVTHSSVKPTGDNRHDFRIRRHLLANDRRGLLDERESRRFQRFDEAAGKPDSNTVFNPELAPVAGFERDGSKRQIVDIDTG